MFAQTLALAATEAFDPTNGLIGTAVTPVILVALVVSGWLAPKWVVKRLESELAKAQEQRDALQKVMTEEMVPALTRATDALKEASAEAAIRRRQQ